MFIGTRMCQSQPRSQQGQASTDSRRNVFLIFELKIAHQIRCSKNMTALKRNELKIEFVPRVFILSLPEGEFSGLCAIYRIRKSS